jgi:hypothetical protein
VHLPDRRRVEPDLHDLRRVAARGGTAGEELGYGRGVNLIRPPRSETGGGGPCEAWWKGVQWCSKSHRRGAFHRATRGPPYPLRGAGKVTSLRLANDTLHKCFQRREIPCRNLQQRIGVVAVIVIPEAVFQTRHSLPIDLRLLRLHPVRKEAQGPAYDLKRSLDSQTLEHFCPKRLQYCIGQTSLEIIDGGENVGCFFGKGGRNGHGTSIHPLVRVKSKFVAKSLGS